jgi:GT2 family glycosyltransferase
MGTRSSLFENLPPPPRGKTGFPWTQASPQLADVLPDGQPYPRVTIVTPSYNQGEFIEETIRSVLLQGYPNLEYIIIDGGSTDGSVEIIKKYEPWLAYWVSEPDRGQSHAINKGLARATGEYVAWLNSDDVYGADLIRQAVEYLEQHPHTAAVYGHADFVDADGRVSGAYQTGAFRIPLFLYYDFIPQPTAVMRRDAIEQVGGLDESLHFCLDYDLWLRLLRVGSLDFLPDLYAQYRVHPASKSSMLQARRWEETTRILAKFFSLAELPATWHKWGPDAIGHAHWCASVEYAKLQQNDLARYHIERALVYAPSKLEKRAFPEIIVGRLANETTEGILEFVSNYFGLIPDSLTSKSLARARTLARAEALLALNQATAPAQARRYGRSALRRDPKWLLNRHVLSRAFR